MERSGFVASCSNVSISVAECSSHGAIISIRDDTFVVTTAHGIVDNVGGLIKLKGGRIFLQLQSTYTDIDWHKLFIWHAYSRSADLRYDCALFQIAKTEDMSGLNLISNSALAEVVSNVAQYNGGEFVASSRVVTEDRFTSLLSPTFSFPGFSGLGMIGSTGPGGSHQLCGIIRGNGYATPDQNIHIPGGNYSLLELQRITLHAEHHSKFEPIFTIIIKAAAITELYNLRNMPMVVDVFNNPCCPIAQVEEARKNDNTTSYGDEEVHEDRSGKKPRVGEAKHSLSNGISAAVGARQGKVVMSLCGGGAVSLE